MSCLLPGGAVLGILEDYALCGKLIPYLIGTGVILILLGFGTLRNELFDIFLELVAVLNLFGDEAEGKHPVEILNDLNFGIARRILLECIIQDGEGQRGIEVVAEVLYKTGAVHFKYLFINFALSGYCGNAAHELFISGFGIIERIIAEFERLPVMALEAEKPVNEGIIALFLKHGYGENIALGFAHLALTVVEMLDVEPVTAPGMAERCFALGDLIGMVRKDIIDAAAVQITVLAEMLDADSGALDMPAGIADAPGTVPFQLLRIEFGLGEPEHEIRFISLIAVLLNIVTNADEQILRGMTGQSIVVFELRGIEIDVAACFIGIAAVKELFDELNVFIYAVRCRFNYIGRLDVELFAVFKEGVFIELRYLHDGLALALCACDHLILAGIAVACEMTDIGDIHDALDIVPCIAEELFKNILHDIGTEIADMSKMVHGRAAGVHFDLAGFMGFELVNGLCKGIIKVNFFHITFLTMVYFYPAGSIFAAGAINLFAIRGAYPRFLSSLSF